MSHPTPYGQTILNLICDRADEAEFSYWLPPIGKTQDVVKYCAAALNKPVRSIAGAISNLVEKHFIDTGWQSASTDHDVGELSVTHQGWLYWKGHSEEKLCRLPEFSEFEFESLEDWLNWDGVDATEVGHEAKALGKKLFRMPSIGAGKFK